jgi:twitching motility protein PilT
LEYSFDIRVKGALDEAIAKKASDILLSADTLPHIRIDGQLQVVTNAQNFVSEDIIQAISTINEQFVNLFQTRKEIDFSFTYSNTRFRANAFHQKGLPAIALRLIPSKIMSYQELGVPPIIARFPKAKRGLVVIAGPTGHGKSTTLA